MAKQKILIADDEAQIREILRIYFEKEGFEVIEAEDGAAAILKVQSEKPDILLLDEPFSALDYQTRLEVCDDISSIIRTRGKTAILVTHDLSEAISVADRILILGSRPGHVTGIMKIQFNQPYDRPLARRNAPDFSVYFNQLWKEIKEHD